MKPKFPSHPREAERVSALHRLDILDTAAEERFDRITRIAQHLFGVDFALISFVDVDRQWFKSGQGLNVEETQRDIAFCTYAVASDSSLIVVDIAERRAATDSLTRTWSRQFILDLLEREIARHERRNGHCFCVALVDIDGFSEVNNTHGHVVGDSVLRESAQRFRLAVRDYDSVGRYGGDEFLVVLPHTDEAGALNVAERIRAGIAHKPLASEIALSVSIGVAEHISGMGRMDLVSVVDRALYEAKDGGRDRMTSTRPILSDTDP